MLTSVPFFPAGHPHPSAFSFFHLRGCCVPGRQLVPRRPGWCCLPDALTGRIAEREAAEAAWGAEETAPPDGILKSCLVRGAGVRRSGSLRMLASNTGSRFDQKEDDVVPDAIQFLLDRSPAFSFSFCILSSMRDQKV